MTTITKPGANPLVATLLTSFCGLGHLIVNGQQRKWAITVVATFVGSLFCFFPGLIISTLSMVDAYQTAARLKSGQTIGENEYSNELLFKVCKVIDSSATFQKK